MKLNKTQQKIFDKSLQSRNIQAIQKLADRDSLELWAETENPTIPPQKYVKPIRVPLSAGIYNLVRQMLP